MITLPIFILSVSYLIFVLVGQVLYKKAAVTVSTESVSSFISSLAVNPPLWIATLFYILAMIVWVLLLKQLPLSRVFPAMSAVLLLSLPIVSYYFLGEPLTLRYWLGVALILAGIALIATEIPEKVVV
mgnify:CR=1 FL=1